MQNAENLENSKRKQFSPFIIIYIFIINESRDSKIMVEYRVFNNITNTNRNKVGKSNVGNLQF